VPNVLAEIAGADDMELAATVQQILDQRPDVRLTDFWRSIEFFKWQSQGRPELAAPPQDERPSLYSESDVPLLRLLVDNPRASYRELAEELGEPYWNVRRRTKALFDSGAIRATAMVDRLSTQAGSSGAVAINIVGAVEDALHRIAAIPHVNIVSWQTGAFNAMAEFQCDSRGELLALSTAIAAVEGVTAVETRLFVKTHIAATPWLLEGSVRA
jgi:DNA-binding Lrp family transcriptional regulator